MWKMGEAVRVGAGVMAVMGALACSKGGGSDYSNAADSGKVAPAARLDTSMSRDMPDSTTGGPDRTGQPGVSGDTLSTRGRPAGTGVRPSDTAGKRP